MVGFSHGKFRVALLTPNASLLDCRAGSVVLPAQDGYLGILRNHCPLMCMLGQGIMQVRDIADRPDAFFVVEGGFAQVSENEVTVLAYEVTTFEGRDEQAIDDLLRHARSVLAGHEYLRTQQEAIDYSKAQLIVRMAEMAGVKLAVERE
jgi:F-type H+-transporting ATPase subunit epsilon